MKATTLILLGKEFVIGLDKDGTQYIGVPSIEKALGYRKDSTREILQSKKMEALAGEDSSLLALGKKKISYNATRYSCVTVETFQLIVEFEADKGNKTAYAMIKTLFREDIQRRFDNAFEIHKTEEQYDKASNDVFLQLREESRVGFKPLFTNWLKGKEDIIWPKEVARLKKAAGIAGSVSVNNMKLSELVKWANAHTAYNAYRHAGKTHEETLKLMYDITTQDVELFDFTKDN